MANFKYSLASVLVFPEPAEERYIEKVFVNVLAMIDLIYMIALIMHYHTTSILNSSDNCCR